MLSGKLLRQTAFFLCALLVSPAAFAAEPGCTGFDPSKDDPSAAQLYQVTPGERVAFTCPANLLSCRRGASLASGDEVVVASVKDNQACAEYHDTNQYNSGTAGWLPLSRLTKIAPASNWIGRWINDDAIILGKPQGDKTRIDATTILELGGGARYGKFGALVDPRQPLARFGYTAGDSEDEKETLLDYQDNPPVGTCEVKLAQLGPYIVASDNNACGGLEVSFGGVFRRSADDANGLQLAYSQCLDRSKGAASDIQNCVGTEFKYQDARLNDAYKRLRGKLEAEWQLKLRAEERQWVAQRDKQCRGDSSDGTGQVVSTNDCTLELTAKRATELESR